LENASAAERKGFAFAELQNNCFLSTQSHVKTSSISNGTTKYFLIDTQACVLKSIPKMSNYLVLMSSIIADWNGSITFYGSGVVSKTLYGIGFYRTTVPTYVCLSFRTCRSIYPSVHSLLYLFLLID